MWKEIKKKKKQKGWSRDVIIGKIIKKKKKYNINIDNIGMLSIVDISIL